MRRYAARTDTGSAELITAARELGFRYEHLGGKIDGLLWRPGSAHIIAVDWKADAKARKTADQQRMIAEGWPILFIYDVKQLMTLRGAK